MRGSSMLGLVGLWLVACGKTVNPSACNPSCAGSVDSEAGSAGTNMVADGGFSGEGIGASGSITGGRAGAAQGGSGTNAGGAGGAAHAGEGGVSAGQGGMSAGGLSEGDGGRAGSSLGGSSGLGGGGQPSAGAAGYVHGWKAGRASCVNIDCDAHVSQSSSANCCYANASDYGCGTASVDG